MKSKKKLMLALAALTMSASATFGFAACSSTPAHTSHDWGEWTVTTDPTCTEKGVKTRGCKGCDAVETDEVAALGHDYGEWTVTTDPTCTGKGEETRTCSRDSSHTEKRDKDAAGHSVKEESYTVTKEATCEEEGSKTGKCDVCQEDVTVTIAATGHKYGEWEQTKAPTCTTEGVETRVCENDAEHTETRPVAVVDHTYGEWIVNYPTATAKGSAKKICSQDTEHAHDIEVELPALNDTDYVKTTEGNKAMYTFKHEAGDITVEAYVDVSVEKAVDIAVENMTKVANSEITMNSTMGVNKGSAKLEYARGDDYVYIKDGGLLSTYVGTVEMFVSKLPDGSYFFPLKTVGIGTGYVDMDKENYPEVVEEIKKLAAVAAGGSNEDKVTASNKIMELTGSLFDNIEDGNESDFVAEDLLKGVPLTLLYAEHPTLTDSSFNGIENVIKALYAVAKTDPNGDFTESASDPDSKGVVTYSFSYGYKGGSYGYFRKYEVSFKLDANYVLVDATVTNTGYSNEYAAGSFTEEEGKVTAKGTPMYVQQYVVVQERYDGGEKPTNPYKKEEMYVTGFDISVVELESLYHTEEMEITGIKTVLAEVGDSIDLVPGASLHIKIKGITPATANLSYDAVKFYLRTEEGDEELSNTYEGGDDWHVKANFNKGDSLLGISCWVAGDLQLVIKTENFEKVITLKVPYQEPTGLTSNVYRYDEITDKSTWETVKKEFTVYEGQTLDFTSTVDHPAYQTSGCTVTVTNKAGEDVTSSVITAGKMVEGVEVYEFKAATAGVYTVTLKTTHTGSNATSVMTITVEEAPDVADMLSGKYVNEDEELTLEFTPAEGGAVSGEAVITLGETTTVTYSYDKATGKFTVEHKSGPDDTTYGLELSEAYYLYLTYTTEQGYNVKVLLTKDGTIVDTLSGEYTYNDGQHRFLAASASGIYKLASSDGVFFKVAGGANQVASAYGVEFALAAGEEVEVWCFMGSGSFTIEYVGPVVEAEGVTLEGGEVFIGSTLTLTPEFTPEDTSVKSGKWTSSNEAIATVDESGVVTGVSAGKVTITFVSNSGAKKATCEVTVTEVVLKAGESEVKVKYGDVVFKFKGEANSTYAFRNYISDGYGGSAGTFDLQKANADGTVDTTAPKAETVALTTDAEGYAYICVHNTRYSYTGIPLDVVITVTQKVSVTGVTLSDAAKAGITLEYGNWLNNSVYLSEHVTVGPENASDKSYTVSFSKEGVLEVNEWSNTVLNSVGEGTVTVTVTTTDGNFTASFEVTVEVTHVTGVEISGEEIEATVGSEIYLSDYVTVSPDDASDTSFTASSSNEDVVTVDEDDATLLHIVGEGEATITVTTTDGEFTATVKVKATVLEVSEDTPLELVDAQAWVSEYFVQLAGGKANTNYKFTAAIEGSDEDLPMLSSVSDGAADYAKFSSDGTLTLTSDTEGNLTLYVYAKYDGTITITVEEVENADPALGENQLTVGSKTLASLTSQGVQLELVGLEAGKTYRVLAFGDDMISYSTDLKFYVGVQQGNPVEFEYSPMGTNHISVAATDADLTDVTIMLVELQSEEPEPADGLTLGETYTTTEDDGNVELTLTVEEAGDYTVTIVDSYGQGVGTYKINGVEVENGGVTVTKTLTLEAGATITVVVWLDGLEITVTKDGTEEPEPADGLTLGETYTTTEDDGNVELTLTVKEAGDYTVTIVDSYGQGVGTYKINGVEVENGGVTVSKTLTLEAGATITVVVWLDGLEITVTKDGTEEPEPEEPVIPTLTLGAEGLTLDIPANGITVALDIGNSTSEYFEISTEAQGIAFVLGYDYGTGTYKFAYSVGTSHINVVPMYGSALSNVTIYLAEAEAPAPSADGLTVGGTYTTTEDDANVEMTVTVEEAGSYTVTIVDTYEQGVGTYKINGVEVENGGVTVSKTLTLEAGDTITIVVWLDGLEITITKD